MMEIRINGQRADVDAGATVADVVRRCGVDVNTTGIAVAVNDAVVPRREWPTRLVAAGDAVEVIHAVQGG